MYTLGANARENPDTRELNSQFEFLVKTTRARQVDGKVSKLSIRKLSITF